MDLTPRACPVCDRPLIVKRSQGIEVDQCAGCAGLWLDRGEFDALVGKRHAGVPLEAALVAHARPPTFCRKCGHTPAGSTEKSTPFSCPTCGGVITALCPVDGIPMDIVDLDDLEMDTCGQCKGIWIDGNERQAVARAARGFKENPERMPQHLRSRPPTGRRIAVPNVPPRPARADEVVVCAGCLAEVPRARTVTRYDDIWCETCVIDGRVPTLQGKSVSELQVAVHQSYTRARSEQRDKRLSVDAVAKARMRPRFTFRGRHRAGGAEQARGILASTVRKVRKLFKPDPWD